MRNKIETALTQERNLPQAGSYNDYGGHKNMDWIRLALRVLLEAEQERWPDDPGRPVPPHGSGP